MQTRETTQHTPGPWEFTNEICGVVEVPQIRAADGTAIAHVYTLDRQPTEANARLIAAAPELLAAIKLIIETRSPLYAGAISVQEAEAQAEAVIARLEGK